MIDTLNAPDAGALLNQLFEYYAGNKSRLARDLKVSRGTLDQWDAIPEKYALVAEALTSGKLSHTDILVAAYVKRHPPQPIDC